MSRLLRWPSRSISVMPTRSFCIVERTCAMRRPNYLPELFNWAISLNYLPNGIWPILRPFFKTARFLRTWTLPDPQFRVQTSGTLKIFKVQAWFQTISRTTLGQASDGLRQGSRNCFRSCEFCPNAWLNSHQNDLQFLSYSNFQF